MIEPFITHNVSFKLFYYKIFIEVDIKYLLSNGSIL